MWYMYSCGPLTFLGDLPPKSFLAHRSIYLSSLPLLYPYVSIISSLFTFVRVCMRCNFLSIPDVTFSFQPCVSVCTCGVNSSLNSFMRICGITFHFSLVLSVLTCGVTSLQFLICMCIQHRVASSFHPIGAQLPLSTFLYKHAANFLF